MSQQPLEATQRFWDEEDEDANDAEIEEATSARLVRVEEGGDGVATPVPPLGTVLAIGRQSSEEHSCNLVLHDAEKRPPVVSSRHALLQDVGGSLQLQILSTSSFTFVNEMAFIAKSGVELEPISLYHGDLLRFGGGKRQADKYERFIYRVDATGFPQLSRQASSPPASLSRQLSLQPSPVPLSHSPSSPAPAAVSRANSGVVAPDSRPAVAAVPPAGPPSWRWQSDKAHDVWSPYGAAQCAVIERAWQRSEKQVRLDAERTLDLISMRQFREDAPSRTRRVRRDQPPAAPPPPDGGTPTGRKRGRDGDGGDGDGGAGSPGCDAARVRVLPDLTSAKRATVRVVALVRSSGEVLSAGSGCIVSRDGHVLTAAHLFISPRNGLLFGGKYAAADVVLAVGMFDADALASRWSHWAELLTPLEVLQERDEKRRLLDLAILRIRGTLVVRPPSFTGTRTRYTVERQGDEPPPQFSDTLRLGRPQDVASGSALFVLGWPSPDGQTSIFVDSTHECLAREGTIIRTRAFIHAGSSGGPALSASLQVGRGAVST